MKKILFLLCFVLNLFSAEFLGTQALNNNSFKIPKAPSGYKPFFINLLSRHSARYLSSDKKLDYALKILSENNKTLTKNGHKLYDKLLEVKNFQNEKFGQISLIGEELANKIGRGFYQNFKPIFTNGRRVDIFYTPILRTKQTAEIFAKNFKDVNISYSLGSNEILRFFDTNKSYIDLIQQEEYKKHLQAYADTKIPLEIINNLMQSDISDKKALKFANALYSVYANQSSAGLDVGINKFLNKQDLKFLSGYKILKDYYTKAGFNKINYDIAKPLLKNFLDTSEMAIKNPNLAGIFRFAHAETIIPFLSLLNSANFTFENSDEVIKNLKLSKISPMMANLAWVFYRNKAGDVIVLQLLNQRVYKFPFKCKFGNFCTFDEVKNYYNEILKS